MEKSGLHTISTCILSVIYMRNFC
uniref:Uncharacterized protein n=1 Tax=Nelumbo nucifera TaxID=4432 RepID=A0A822Z951_NELNU|nr:TPA_asm: hypothetical protein HUJ06_014307 [Nelumbo nucifera]DAD39985.1 TPA_asm: hypothetical protein HUJ06_014308 [Nelumbo nucifera]